MWVTLTNDWQLVAQENTLLSLADPENAVFSLDGKTRPVFPAGTLS